MWSFHIRGPPRSQGYHAEEDSITTSGGYGGEGVQSAMGNVLHTFGGVGLEKGNTGGNQ